MLQLYDSPLSGNCYKVRLLLSHLGRDYERIHVDPTKSETKAAGFLAKNPHGRLPVLRMENGQYLAESNAILYYLSRDSSYFPDQLEEQSQVMRWMFFEQNTLEPPLAGARFLLLFNAKTLDNESVIKRRNRAQRALLVMETRLASSPYIAGKNYTIADMALYAYTHRAAEAEIDLAGYPAIESWCERVTQQPGYLDMQV